MDEDENENIFVEEEISDDDELNEIHPDDMSDAMRTLNQALIDADDHIDGNHTYYMLHIILLIWYDSYLKYISEKSRDIDQSVFDEMVDIFGSKVLSKLKNKDRKKPDCSQERDHGSTMARKWPRKWSCL